MPSTPSRQPRLLACVNHRFAPDACSCAARGSRQLATVLEEGIAERRLNVCLERVRCLNHCQEGPALRLVPGGRVFLGAGPEMAKAILDALEEACGRRDEALDPLALLGS